MSHKQFNSQCIEYLLLTPTCKIYKHIFIQEDCSTFKKFSHTHMQKKNRERERERERTKRREERIINSNKGNILYVNHSDMNCSTNSMLLFSLQICMPSLKYVSSKLTAYNHINHVTLHSTEWKSLCIYSGLQSTSILHHTELKSLQMYSD